MKNKVIAALASVALAVGIGVVSATPAQALPAVQPGAVVYNVQVTTQPLYIKVQFIQRNYGYAPPRGFAAPVLYILVRPHECITIKELNWSKCNNYPGDYYKLLTISQVHAMRTR
jgi:hypothetical protein